MTIIRDIMRAERLRIFIIVKSLIKKFNNVFNIKRDTKKGIHEINRLTVSFDIAITTASRNQTINTIRTIISKVTGIQPHNLILTSLYIKKEKTKTRLKSLRTSFIPLHVSN